MTRRLIALRRRLRQRAHSLCEYCHTLMDLTGHDFTIDHIIPEVLGGTNDFDNLCFCCFWCNNFKQARTHARDPRTGRLSPHFNPRYDSWNDHFRWSSNAFKIIGRTAIGRSTIGQLRLNRPELMQARRIWVKYGLHPPESRGEKKI